MRLMSSEFSEWGSVAESVGGPYFGTVRALLSINLTYSLTCLD
jgi:hypothetical protein